MGKNIKLWGGPFHGHTSYVSDDCMSIKKIHFRTQIPLPFLLEKEPLDTREQVEYIYVPHRVKIGGQFHVLWTCSPQDADKWVSEKAELFSFLQGDIWTSQKTSDQPAVSEPAGLS